MSLDDLAAQNKCIGLKQSKKAIREGRARFVYFAQDAGEEILQPLVVMCKDLELPTAQVPTMKELGSACGIKVGASVVAVLDK